MTNDEYQAMAREQRRREEEAAFRRNLQEQQERQQRQQRQQEEARRLANQSRSMGQMGALPTFGAPLNAGAYQEGLWEYQRRQQQQKQQARRTVAPVTQWNAGASPVSYPQPAYNYTAAEPRRRRRFIGGITSWFVHRVWPFSIILRAGNALQDAGGRAKGLLALLAGCGCAALLALPQFYVPLQQQLRDTPVPVGTVFFACGALLGWLLPKILGGVAVATVFLIGIAVEVGVYAGVCWGCWAIAKAVGWTS